jgi:excisionase family DNA binding protein
LKLELKQPERLAYTAEEVAALTGASVLSVEREIKSGALPHLKLGQRTLVPASAINHLLESAE